MDIQLTNASPKSEQRGHTLGIRGRLLLGFTIVAVILLIAVTITLSIVKSTEIYAENVIDTNLPLYDRMMDLGLQVSEAQSAIRAWIISGNPDYKIEYTRYWENITRSQVKIEGLLKNAPNSELSKHWSEIKGLLNQLKNIDYSIEDKSKINSLLITKSADIENKLLDIIDGPLLASGERIGGVFDMQYEDVNKGTSEIINLLNIIKLTAYSLLAIIIFVSIIVALITAKSILNPLNKAIVIAQNIASGKRDNKIIVKSNDETGLLLEALSQMQDAINENEIKLRQSEAHTRELFDNIVQTAKNFSAHSSKVASGDLRERLNISQDNVMATLGNDLNSMTDNLSIVTSQITDASHNMVTMLEEVKQAVNVQSSGAAEQASSINQITASLSEIEKSSSQTMDKARVLGEISERTRKKGQSGIDAVEQSILGMKAVRDKVQLIAQTILELSNQTQQVGEITSVVNNLAQQSKMLALNASIEAAKAGEAGQGFAVVASEVKNLAEQSEQSTIQVQKILEDIRHATEKAVMVTEEGTKGVDHGTMLVEQTGEAVRSLNEVINETSIASQQIEAAVRQEGVGIEQITIGMNEINQVTTSFVASANQTFAAINNLADITKKLKEQVDIYKV